MEILNFFFNFWNIEIFLKILNFCEISEKKLKFYEIFQIFELFENYPPYPWYFNPPTHGILTPLPMVFWPPYPRYIKPSLLVEMRGVNLPWGGSKYNDEKAPLGSIYHMKIDPGVNIPWGSKYHMTPVVILTFRQDHISKLF
jgi:hypothetical protein